jgi:hypothetical protein
MFQGRLRTKRVSHLPYTQKLFKSYSAPDSRELIVGRSLTKLLPYDTWMWIIKSEFADAPSYCNSLHIPAKRGQRDFSPKANLFHVDVKADIVQKNLRTDIEQSTTYQLTYENDRLCNIA